MRLNIFKSRDKPRNSAPGQSYGFLFGGTSSGKSVVNERSAMQMTAVYVCVRILSEATAGLPLHLYRCWRPLILTIKNGDREAWRAMLPGKCKLDDVVELRKKIAEAKPLEGRTEPYVLRGRNN